MSVIKIAIMAAVLEILFVSLPATAERASGDISRKIIRTFQVTDLKPFTTLRDGTQVIHLPAGTYRISTTLFLPSNSVLEGEGDATVLKAATPFSGAQFISNADLAGGNRNISIRNLKIEFRLLQQLAGYAPGILRFENVEHLQIINLTVVNDSPMYGIDLFAQVRDATVEGCTLTNTNRVSGGGVVIRNGKSLPAKATSDIVVRNNRIESVRDESISVFAWQGMLENIRIEQNTIKADGASFGIAAYGINSPGQQGQLRGVDIIGNSVEGSTVGGIGVMGGAEQVNVVKNTVTNTKKDGIFLHPGGKGLPTVGNVRVLRNTISNTGRHGIFADGRDVQLQQNEITNCSGNGVYAAAGVSLIGNVINVAHPGILVEGRSAAIIRDNVLRKAGGTVYLH